ncbi:MAG: hypothetical protein V4679_17470 [Pseudomonadota bacterium]
MPQWVLSLLEIAGSKRILQGSDWPCTPERPVAALAARLDATPLMSEAPRSDSMHDHALARFPKFA